MFVEFQNGGGTLEVALLLEAAFSLDFAELVHGFLELAGEALRVHAEGGEGAMGVDDVEIDGRFEVRNAVETPGGVDEFLSELSFGGRGGLVFVEKLAAVALVGGGVLGGEDRGATGEAVREGIEGRTQFAGGGAGSGGALGVGAVDGGAERKRERGLGIYHRGSPMLS